MYASGCQGHFDEMTLVRLKRLMEQLAVAMLRAANVPEIRTTTGVAVPMDGGPGNHVLDKNLKLMNIETKDYVPVNDTFKSIMLALGLNTHYIHRKAGNNTKSIEWSLLYPRSSCFRYPVPAN